MNQMLAIQKSVSKLQSEVRCLQIKLSQTLNLPFVVVPPDAVGNGGIRKKRWRFEMNEHCSNKELNKELKKAYEGEEMNVFVKRTT